MSRCSTCKYMQMPHDGGHCYMFKTEPVPCAQWTSRDEPLGAPDAAYRVGRHHVAVYLLDPGLPDDPVEPGHGDVGRDGEIS